MKAGLSVFPTFLTFRLKNYLCPIILKGCLALVYLKTNYSAFLTKLKDRLRSNPCPPSPLKGEFLV